MKSFVKWYFEGKTGEALRKTITPDWNTTSRHLELLDIPRDINSVLEIGCGIGRLLKELNKDIPICIGYDASEDMIREGEEYCANTSVDLRKCDGNGEISVVDGIFDYAFSIITFQHIPNTDTVNSYLGEMYRALRYGGTLKFQILKNNERPDNDLWSYHDTDDLIEYLGPLIENIKIEDTGRWLFISGQKF